MLRLVLSWLSGGVLETLLRHVERRIDNETERRRISAGLAAEEIRAEIAARAEARAVLVAESGFLFSAGRLGRLLFVLPLALWWWAVCLDSVFLFGWGVAEVPVLRDWGGAIVTSLFLVEGAQGAVRATLAARRARDSG